MLIVAGAGPVAVWLDSGRLRIGRTAAGIVIVLSLLAGLLIALPVLPASDAGPIVAMNPDVGETIGWPELVRTVARVADQVPAGSGPLVILTSNYSEPPAHLTGTGRRWACRRLTAGRTPLAIGAHPPIATARSLRSASALPRSRLT